MVIPKKIAKSIESGIEGSVLARAVDGITLAELDSINLLIVGSPVHGGRPTPALQEFLESLPSLKGVNVAAFDTRFEIAKQNYFLKLLMKTIGYAAPKVASLLTQKGGTLVAEPEGFIVNGKEGPLAESELDRAITWAKHLSK